MQIKKEEMKDSLLKAGEDEFFEKGYDKASIRLIVKRAHTTIGNFYNYFDSKEALYKELVESSYIQITSLIKDHTKFESVEQIQKFQVMDQPDFDYSEDNIESIFGDFLKSPTKKTKAKKAFWLPKNTKLWRFIIRYIVKKFFPPIDRRFALLMTGSSSTPYFHARKDLEHLLSNHFNDHIKDYAPNYPHIEMGTMIAHQLIEGLVEIGRHDFDKEKAQDLTTEQLLFIIVGVITILQGGI